MRFANAQHIYGPIDSENYGNEILTSSLVFLAHNSFETHEKQAINLNRDKLWEGL